MGVSVSVCVCEGVSEQARGGEGEVRWTEIDEARQGGGGIVCFVFLCVSPSLALALSLSPSLSLSRSLLSSLLSLLSSLFSFLSSLFSLSLSFPLAVSCSLTTRCLHGDVREEPAEGL